MKFQQHLFLRYMMQLTMYYVIQFKLIRIPTIISAKLLIMTSFIIINYIYSLLYNNQTT